MLRIVNASAGLLVGFVFLGCSSILGAFGNASSTQLPEATPSYEVFLTRESTPWPENPPDSCPVSNRQKPPFIPPAPYPAVPPHGTGFWYGSEALWTHLPDSGAWAGLPQDEHGYFQKVVWWREGYQVDVEPQPDLVILGERLDDNAPALKVPGPVTNGFTSEFGQFMLAGVVFPAPGCWELTARYRDSELSFVIWVAP